MRITCHRLILIAFALTAVSCKRGAPASEEHAGHGHEEGAPEPAKEAGGHAEHEGHDEHEGETEGVIQLPEGTAVQVKLAAVERRPLATERDTTGKVDYVQSAVAHVAPRIPGRVHRVFAQLGDEVKAGEVVAELDSVEIGTAKAAYVQARTREDLARRTFEREKGLHQERITSERELLEAEAALNEARSSTQSAEQTLRLYGLDAASIRKMGAGDSSAFISVRAPIAGRITEHHASLGELVSPETRLMTVADLSRVWVWIDVPERDVALVHVDDDVNVMSDAYAGERFTGKVSYLTPEVDADSRTVRARIEAANPERKLLPGMFVNVRISDPHGAGLGGPGTLLVPAAAVQRDGDESVAFVVTGPRRFERRELRLGRSTAEWMEVLEGVAEGEQVVIEGAFILKSEAARHSLGGGHSH